MYIQQQTLQYTDRKEDIATVAYVLDLLREKDFHEASRQLVILMNRLQEEQRPKLIDYDPRADMAAIARRA